MFSDAVRLAVFALYPARIAACVAFKSMRYSRQNISCFALSANYVALGDVMSNVKIYAGLVNGDLMPIIEGKTSEEIVMAFTGDDTGAPPSSITIEVVTNNGSKVKILIPNSTADASVTIDGKRI